MERTEIRAKRKQHRDRQNDNLDIFLGGREDKTTMKQPGMI